MYRNEWLATISKVQRHTQKRGSLQIQISGNKKFMLQRITNVSVLGFICGPPPVSTQTSVRNLIRSWSGHSSASQTIGLFFYSQTCLWLKTTWNMFKSWTINMLKIDKKNRNGWRTIFKRNFLVHWLFFNKVKLILH